VLVVLGAYEVETSAPTVRCPEWELGRGASLRCGLHALASEVEAAVVVLADGPNLAPAAIDRVVDVWHESGDRGHPVLLGRSVWERVPDPGARTLPALLVPCDDLGSPGDVDLPADLPERFKPPPAE